MLTLGGDNFVTHMVAYLTISHKGFGYTIKLRRLATVLGSLAQGCEHNQNEF